MGSSFGGYDANGRSPTAACFETGAAIICAAAPPQPSALLKLSRNPQLLHAFTQYWSVQARCLFSNLDSIFLFQLRTLRRHPLRFATLPIATSVTDMTSRLLDCYPTANLTHEKHQFETLTEALLLPSPLNPWCRSVLGPDWCWTQKRSAWDCAFQRRFETKERRLKAVLFRHSRSES